MISSFKYKIEAIVTWLAVLLPTLAFGRGEWWVSPPPVPPPVATLTNEARYVEWKWRTDVADPTTGVGQDRAKEELLALSKEQDAYIRRAEAMPE